MSTQKIGASSAHSHDTAGRTRTTGSGLYEQAGLRSAPGFRCRRIHTRSISQLNLHLLHVRHNILSPEIKHCADQLMVWATRSSVKSVLCVRSSLPGKQSLPQHDPRKAAEAVCTQEATPLVIPHEHTRGIPLKQLSHLGGSLHAGGLMRLPVLPLVFTAAIPYLLAL